MSLFDALADFAKPERQARWANVIENKINGSLFVFHAKFEPPSPVVDYTVIFM